MWIVIESGPEGLEVYPCRDSIHAVETVIGIILELTDSNYRVSSHRNTFAQAKEDHGMILEPLNSIAEGPVHIYAREVQS